MRLELKNLVLTEQVLNIKIQYRLYMLRNKLKEVKECVEDLQKWVNGREKACRKLKRSILFIDKLFIEVGDILK